MQTTFLADCSALFAASIGSSDLSAFCTKGFSGKVALNLATQFRSLVESALADFVRRIALVFGALGIAVTAIAAIKRDSNRLAMIVIAIAMIVIAIGVIVIAISMIVIAISVVVIAIGVVVIAISMVVTCSPWLVLANCPFSVRAQPQLTILMTASAVNNVIHFFIFLSSKN